MNRLHRKTLALIFILLVIFGAFQPGLLVMANTNAAPTINIWYGSNQGFGHHGQPQTYVNILGNVSDTDGIKSLSYSLNGGSPISLSMGPDDRRLLKPGDFNVDLFYSQLGDINKVTITAVDNTNQTSQVEVTVQKNVVSWPVQSYTVAWNTETPINDQAQVVDGKWSLSASGVTTDEVGYDRLIAVGEMDWTNFEVSVPITVHGIDSENGYDDPSFGPAVGLILGWTGHTDNPPIIAGKQPKEGYLPYGSIGVYRWETGGNGLRLYLNDVTADTNGQSLSYGMTYIFKMRMQDVPGQGQSYWLKVWQSGQSEPSGWTLQGDGDLNDPQRGCILLMAHHVDATFGNVAITPLSDLPQTYTLSLTPPQHGTVTVSPDKELYSAGESVTLTATPDPTYQFGGWTINGQSKGTINPYTFQITGNTTISAAFTQDLYSLSVTSNPGSGGTVTLSPANGPYPAGSTVTLTAYPSPGWGFDGWGGSLSSIENPVQITMTGDMAVTANFSERYTLAVTPVGQGTVSIAPSSGPYSPGSQVTLTANASPGWAFAGWSGGLTSSDNPLNVTMTKNLALTATFKRAYRLTVNVAQGGAVIRNPAKDTYLDGEVVTLTAKPDDGWSFAGWSGISGSSNPVEVTMTGDLSVDAVFLRGQYKLTLNTIGSGSVKISPIKTSYQAGEQVTLTPISAPGWGFVGWSGDLSGKTSPVTLTITKNLAITATFSRYGVYIPLVLGPP